MFFLKITKPATFQDDPTRIFAALANHARKVQNNEFQKQPIQLAINHNTIVDDDYRDPIKPASSNHDKKQYRFSYAVKDGHSGDDFSHTQKQENGAVQGSYKVQLPDGRVQVVKYTADDVHGYRADVTYENEPVKQYHAAPIHVPDQPNYFYPRKVKQVRVSNLRHTVTPTPYIEGDYNVRAPSVFNYYPVTTAIPRHYWDVPLKFTFEIKKKK